MEYDKIKTDIEHELNSHFNPTPYYEYNDLVLYLPSVWKTCFNICCFICICYNQNKKSLKEAEEKERIYENHKKLVKLRNNKEYQINYINKIIVNTEKDIERSLEMIENQKYKISILRKKLEIEYNQHNITDLILDNTI